MVLIGIVGGPNKGKSTFFKAATLADAEIANYPFTTIKPNSGVSFVRVKCPEKEFNLKCSPNHGFCIRGNRFLPVKLLDVAGLVPDAHLGKGLGNEFLSDLSQADALIHIVDVSGSTTEKGEPCEAGTYDPCNDIRFLEEEIDLWFDNILVKSCSKFAKRTTLESKDEDKEIAEQFSGLKIDLGMVKDARKKTELTKKIKDWSEDEVKNFAKQLRIVSKPIIIAANKVDIPCAEANLKIIKEKFPDLKIIPCSSEAELALKEAAKHELVEYIPGEKEFKVLAEDKLNEKQKKGLEFVKKFLDKWGSTGVQDCLNLAVFEELDYIVAYPVEDGNKFSDNKGNVFPDGFLLRKGSNALDLAYAVHSAIGDKFIKAIDARTKQVIGKEHTLKNNDIIEIVSGK
ncbi:MAG: redox-regulated ATPase YchF [Candidatus Woesearchaeota archaeon]|nr:MAG: redox-regulated ATPase YchF [Candidatus Woesearchaeota archaeon]